jgi:hypothetical protein
VANYDPENWRRFWQEAKEHQHKADQERHEAAENTRVKQIVGSVESAVEQLRRQNDEKAPKNKGERRWKRAEVLGLWAAAAVGLTAIIIANNDAGKQLTTMNNQSGAMQGQLNEMKAASEQTARLVAANEKVANATQSAGRAWVGPFYAAVANMKSGEAIKIDIAYGNTGREPALANTATDPKIFSRTEWSGGVAAQNILFWENECMNNTPLNELSAQVIFPTTGPASLAAHFDSTSENAPENVRFKASDQLISGEEFLAIKGCFTYKTAEKIHHTAFCYYYNAKLAVGGQLSICNVGHRAD